MLLCMGGAILPIEATADSWGLAVEATERYSQDFFRSSSRRSVMRLR